MSLEERSARDQASQPSAGSIGSAAADIKGQIIGVPNPIRDWVAVQTARNQSETMTVALNIWRQQVSNDNRLRVGFGKALMRIFDFQVFVAFALTVLMGLHYLQFPQWAATAFFVGVFSEIAYMLHQIVRYLFTDRVGTPLGQVLSGLFQDNENN